MGTSSFPRNRFWAVVNGMNTMLSRFHPYWMLVPRWDITPTTVKRSSPIFTCIPTGSSSGNNTSATSTPMVAARFQSISSDSCTNLPSSGYHAQLSINAVVVPW